MATQNPRSKQLKKPGSDPDKWSYKQPEEVKLIASREQVKEIQGSDDENKENSK